MRRNNISDHRFTAQVNRRTTLLNLVGNLLEDIVQCIRIGCRKVVAGTLRRALIVGQVLHEPVCFLGINAILIAWTVGVRAIEDTHRVDIGTFASGGVCLGNCLVSNVLIVAVPARRTIGKYDNNTIALFTCWNRVGV